MKTTNNKRFITAFFLKHVPCACFVYLLAIANTHASPNKKSSTYTHKTKLKVQLSLSPLTPERKKAHSAIKTLHFNLNEPTKIQKYIDFSKMKPKNKLKKFKEQYLTLYSRKRGKIKAAYIKGSYALNYTQNW